MIKNITFKLANCFDYNAPGDVADKIRLLKWTRKYWSFIKRQRSGTPSDNEWYKKWQGMTTSDNEWYNEWQRMTASDATSDKEWQLVIQRVTTSDN